MKVAIVTTILLALAAIGQARALADGEGTAEIQPGPTALAGTRGTWTITYHPGAAGMQTNGGIRLRLSGYPIRLFAMPQTTDPAGPDYTTAHCTNDRVPVQVRAARELRGGWQQIEEVTVTVGEPGLSADDALVVVYGDTSGGGPGGSTRGPEGDDLPVRLYSDTNGDGKFAALAQFPTLTLVGGPASRLAVCAPSQAIVGQPTTVSVSARDPRNAVATENLPAVTLDGPGLGAPVEVSFTEGERAVAPAEVTFRRPGVHRLTARPSQTPGELATIGSSDFVAASRPGADAEPGFTPELEKVEVSAIEARPGSTLRVVGHWRNSGTAPPEKGYRVMCHLQRRPPQGRALANWDHNPSTATTEWEPREPILDATVGAIPASIPPGEHALTVGLYVSPAPGKFVVLASYEICRIKVGPDSPLITDISAARSNPIEVFDKQPKRRLLWGDLHCHTENSHDGSGSVTGLYRYARDVSRLDFCACSDHVSPRYPADQWERIQQAAEGFNEPGRFVSILGYEWSNAWHGDKNVYFAQDYEPIRVPESGEAEDLWPMLRGVDCVVIPHHPAYPVGLRGVDWGRIDQDLVPVVEMCSGHGLAEYLGNPRPYGGNKPMGPSLPGGFAQDALTRGLRLGFICSSDDHSAHAGKMGFLVAVYVDSFDRAGILNALRDRRCYGSTGARILIDVRANDEPMGAVIRCQTPPRLSVRVHGTNPLQLVEVVKDGEVCYSRSPDSESCKFDYMAQGLDRQESYYYVRVTQTDGEMAWSSPIFVRNLGPRPRLEIGEVKLEPSSPTAGETCRVSVPVRNDGNALSGPGTLRMMLDGPPAVPVGRERMPARSGIGGLMATPGLQVWRWPVDETSVNVFLRWGGADGARDCAGQVRLIDAADHYWTPFHVEDNDTIEESDPGTIRWSTEAEAGTGDGLNIWVRIDLRNRTRLEIDATRAGERRPDEIFTHTGQVTALPFEIDLVEYDPGRSIGDAPVPPLQPGEERAVEMEWRPPEAREGRLIGEVLSAEGKCVATNASNAPPIAIR